MDSEELHSVLGTQLGCALSSVSTQRTSWVNQRGETGISRASLLGTAPGKGKKPERTRLGPPSLWLLICVPNLLGRNYKAGEVRVSGRCLEGRDINVVL